MDGQFEECEEEYKIRRQKYLVSIRKKNRSQILNTKRKRYSQINANDSQIDDRRQRQEWKEKTKGKSKEYFNSTNKTKEKDEESRKQNCPQQKMDLSRKSQRLYGPKQKLKKQWQTQVKQFKIVVDKQLEGIILQIMRNPLGQEDIEQAMRLSHLIQDCYSLHKGIISLRKIISKRNVDRQNIILKIIDNNLLTVFINLLQQDVFKQLKLQCLWIITNMAESHHQFCERIVLRGGITPILAILKEREEYLVDQAIWALGNIAADSIQYQQMILQSNGLHEIIELAMQVKKKQLFDSCIWAAINLCSGCNNEHYKYQLKKTIDLLCAALIAGFLDDSETFGQALGMIYKSAKYLCERIVESGIAPYLIEVYRTKDNLLPQNKNVILKILTKFSEQGLCIIEILLNHGILQLIHGALLDNKQSIVDNALYILSNLFLGTTQQIDLIFQDQQLFRICKLLIEEGSEEIQYEACYVFFNVFNYRNTSKLVYLFKQLNAVEMIDQLLDSSSIVLIEVALKFLTQLLCLGDKYLQQGNNPFQIQVLNSKLINKLYQLQNHHKKQIYILTVQIIEYYFYEISTLLTSNGVD